MGTTMHASVGGVATVSTGLDATATSLARELNEVEVAALKRESFVVIKDYANRATMNGLRTDALSLKRKVAVVDGGEAQNSGRVCQHTWLHNNFGASCFVPAGHAEEVEGDAAAAAAGHPALRIVSRSLRLTLRLLLRHHATAPTTPTTAATTATATTATAAAAANLFSIWTL